MYITSRIFSLYTIFYIRMAHYMPEHAAASLFLTTNVVVEASKPGGESTFNIDLFLHK